MRKACLLLLAVCSSPLFLAVADSSDGAVPFPEGYRKWPFLHATVFGPKNGIFGKRPCEKPCTGGIMYFYANDKAMEGFRTGTFADGAVIADELLETLETQDPNTAKEGSRRGVGVMVKDQQRYEATGGWGFASFEADSKIDKLDAKAKNNCFQCHVPKKDHGYVYTVYQER